MNMLIQKRNRQKGISLLLIIAFILTMLTGILPEGILVYADNEEGVTEDVYGEEIKLSMGLFNTLGDDGFDFIKEIKITQPAANDVIEGEPLPQPVKKDAAIRIIYYFEIPNTMDIKEGDSFIITIPEEIQKINKNLLNHPLNDDDGNTIAYANFYTDNTVDIIFTDGVEGKGDIEGNFWIERRFEESKIGNQGETDIVFKLNEDKDYTIKVKFPIIPEETNMYITKSNTYSVENNEITWTIKIKPETKPTQNLSIEDVVITDNIESNQTYVANSFNISGIDESKVTVTEPSGSSTELKVLFKEAINTNPKEEYTITFKTNPNISGFTENNQTINFKNTANVAYTDIHTNNKVNKSSNESSRPITSNFITKVGKYDYSNKKIHWTITINNNYFDLPADMEIVDTIDNTNNTGEKRLKLDKNSITLDEAKVTIDNTNGPLKYAEDSGKGTLTYQFVAKPQSRPYVLKYSTEVIDLEAYISNDSITYNNEAKLIGTGIPDNTKFGVGVAATTNILSKKGAGYDASKHEITWEITVNSNKIEIENPEVTDTIPDGLEYVLDSFKVNDSQTDEGFSITGNEFIYDFTGKKTDNKIIDTYTLTFKTKVLKNDVYAVNGNKTFTNNVKLTGDNIPDTSTTGSQTCYSTVISKIGKGYDYINRIITWEVKVNQNQMAMENAYIEDIISEGQEFIDGSVKIGEDVAGESNTVGTAGYHYDKVTKKLSYYFPKTINTTQTITFQTKITDLKFFHENEDTDVENTVKLFGDDIPNNNKVEVKGKQRINRTAVKKTGHYEDGDAFIEWRVIVNKNQLEITNPVLVDNLQEGLEPDISTVQLFKLKIGTDGEVIAGKEKEINLTADNIEYDPDTRDFKFKFNKTITDAYLLKFQTDIADGYHNATFNNTIAFEGSYAQKTSSFNNLKVAVNTMGGGATVKNGSITVEKVDKEDNSNKLQGAKFDLFNSLGLKVGDTKFTDIDGKVIFDKLKFGIPYTVKETVAPEGYYIEEGKDEYTFVLSSSNKDITYTFENGKIRGNIEFKKVDKDTKAPISGAEFRLFKKEDPIIAIGVDVTSDNNGIVRFENVEYGEYVIREVTPAEGYLSNTLELKVKITKNGEVVYADSEGNNPHKIFELENTIKKGNLKITKVDGKDFNKKLQRAEFKIFKVVASDEIYVNTLTTDVNGIAEINNLIYGDYILRETKAPEGYYINQDDHEFSITVEGETERITISNEKIPVGTLVINKLDAWDGKPIYGVEFEVYDKDSNLVSTVITNEDGVAETKDLLVGISGEFATYTIKEVNTPEGYHPLKVEKTIIIKKDLGNSITIENHPLRTLVIKKIASGNSDNVLAGAVFEIKNVDGEVIAEITTEEDGLAQLKDLTYGEYIIRETKAPAKYRLDSTAFTITIDENTHLIHQIERENIKRSSGGGGGGGGTPSPEAPEPQTPETPGEPEIPEEVEILKFPERPEDLEKTMIPRFLNIREKTPEATPLMGELKLPENSIPKVKTPPANGEVTIETDGKWNYTPKAEFVGKDSFSIKITNTDGTEEEVFIEVDVLGSTGTAEEITNQKRGEEKVKSENKEEKLPQTGEEIPIIMYLIGGLMILLGIMIKKKQSSK